LGEPEEMSFKCDGKKIVVWPGRNLANVFKREPMKRHKYLWTDAICTVASEIGFRLEHFQISC
jgi:hypothetical protein